MCFMCVSVYAAKEVASQNVHLIACQCLYTPMPPHQVPTELYSGAAHQAQGYRVLLYVVISRLTLSLPLHLMYVCRFHTFHQNHPSHKLTPHTCHQLTPHTSSPLTHVTRITPHTSSPLTHVTRITPHTCHQNHPSHMSPDSPLTHVTSSPLTHVTRLTPHTCHQTHPSHMSPDSPLTHVTRLTPHTSSPLTHVTRLTPHTCHQLTPHTCHQTHPSHMSPESLVLPAHSSGGSCGLLSPTTSTATTTCILHVIRL